MKSLYMVECEDFSVLENAQGITEIGKSEIRLGSEDPERLSGCFAPLPLAQAEKVLISFSAVSSVGHGGGILFVDLCADGYDREDQEYRLPLQEGRQQVSFVLPIGDEAPDTARLRFFTLDRSDVRIQQLRVAVLSGESNRNLETAAIVAVVFAIIGMSFAYLSKAAFFRELFCCSSKTARTTVFAAFLMALYLPGVVFAMSRITGIPMDVTLQGNFIPTKCPEFATGSFLDGSFQQRMEQWWNEAFGLRGVAIKTYNQIRYSAFREGTRVIGKNGSIFEPLYIQEELGLAEQDGSNEENQQSLRAYVERLNTVADQLRAVGKPLIVYTTPNKASFQKEEIPMRFTTAQTESAISLISYFRQLRETFRFAYLDSYELLREETEPPVFYKTGIHWSRTAEQKVSQALMAQIQDELGKPTAQIKLGQMNISETPYWRDADVYDLLNVWKGKTDKYYYEYASEAAYDAADEKIGVLLIGGSFSMGFEREFVKLELGKSIHYVNYSYGSGYPYIREDNDVVTPLASLDEMDLQTLLDQSDIVLMEINEAVFREKAEQDEFLNRLETFLNVYEPGKPAMEALDFQRRELIRTEAIEGFYEPEETHIWSTRSSSVRLRDERIFSVGLELQLYIPEELAAEENDCLTVSVNGRTAWKHSLTETGDFTVSIPQEVLPSDRNCLISFQCDKSFYPGDLGSTDNRELSFAVLYAGARR